MMDDDQTITKRHPDLNLLNLPKPRIWTPQHLADFLGVSMGWIYSRTGPTAEDRIPRVTGVGRLRFDTHSPQFQEWMTKTLGYTDKEKPK